MPSQKHAVHFGAGNIGRGFIGPLLAQSGYHVTFADVQDEVIDALNKKDTYTVHILDQKKQKEEIGNVSGVKSTDDDALDAIAEADIVTTSVGPEVLKRIAPAIAKGISKRRERKKDDLNIIACENMVGATSALKEEIEKALEGNDEDLKYIKEHVGFPDCEVDRIVPPFESKDKLEVGVEGFYEWVVDKTKVKGDLSGVKGMTLKENLSPFLERKLFTLNCGHAMLAFLGFVKGYKTINEAFDDEEIRKIAHGALEESGAALIKKHGFDEKEHNEYIGKTMMRYANPNIHDELPRVSRKPLRKLGENERLTGPTRMCKEYDLPRDNLLKGIAAAFYFDVKDDEESAELQKMLKEKGLEATLEETTGFKKGDEEYETILKNYKGLKKWRK
ncbi:hypothetical protein YB2330_005557 [Saitoella coloradoensis]